jgi:hypothetical protein
MTTRVIIVNLGPGVVEVKVGQSPVKTLQPGDHVPPHESYLYKGQDIVIQEKNS